MVPKVSIVIPVYNGANYMREAIDSALNQTYENCEVIVVNDGSTDETEQIALSYGERIRYFFKENGGVSTALNLGIKKMTGDYFCYLPHDDLFLPDKVKIQMTAVQGSGDLTTIAWSKTNLLLEEERKCIDEGTNYYYNDKNYLMNGNFPVYLGLVRTISVMIHKSYFERYGLFDDKLYTSQDYDMWYRIFQNHRTIYTDIPLVCYRVHSLQGTNTDSSFTANCVELAKKKFLEISEEEIGKLFGNRYRFLYYMMIYYKEEAQWKECWDMAYKKFCEIDEPQEVEQECRKLNSYLQESNNIQENRIVIWCAGKNAIRLLREFRERKIPVYALCDRDDRKQGTVIQGSRCLAPDEIDKENSRIIVSKDDPEDLSGELLAQGFKHVISYKEIGSRIHYTLPYKQEVLKEMVSN